MESAKTSNVSRHLSPEKTAAILDGATQVFLQEGYAGTTMDRVAAASGVSKATIYSHFQDKERLFNALMEQMVREMEWAQCVQELRQASSDMPEQVLRRLANDMLDNCIHNPDRITFIRLVMGESGRFPELGRAFVLHADKPALDAITHYLGSCSELNLPNPAATARIFMGTLIFYLITQEMLHSQDIVPMDRNQLVEHLISLILGK